MANDILTMVVKTYRDAVEAANGLADRIAAASKDTKARVHEIRNDPNVTDPKVKEGQEWLEKANAAIEKRIAELDAYIAENLVNKQEEDVDALKTQYGENKTNATTARKFLDTLPGVSDEEKNAALKDVPELKTLRGGSSSGGGGKRPRLERVSFSNDNGTTYSEVWEEIENPKTKVKENKVNFTIVARKLAKEYGAKVEVKELQAAAFEAAGTDDLSTLNGKPFDFAYSVGEGEKAKNVFLRVQPKDNSESESTDAESSDSEAEAEVSESA
jgi:hypothetical protein